MQSEVLYLNAMTLWLWIVTSNQVHQAFLYGCQDVLSRWEMDILNSFPYSSNRSKDYLSDVSSHDAREENS